MSAIYHENDNTGNNSYKRHYFWHPKYQPQLSKSKININITKYIFVVKV